MVGIVQAGQDELRPLTPRPPTTQYAVATV